jgi:hypothetical protein
MYIAWMTPFGRWMENENPLLWTTDFDLRMAYAKRRLEAVAEACRHPLIGLPPFVNLWTAPGIWNGRLTPLLVMSLPQDLELERAQWIAMFAGNLVRTDALFLGSLHTSELSMTRISTVLGLHPVPAIGGNGVELNVLEELDAFLQQYYPRRVFNAFVLGHDLHAPAFPGRVSESVFESMMTDYADWRDLKRKPKRPMAVDHCDRHGWYAKPVLPITRTGREAEAFALLVAI